MAFFYLISHLLKDFSILKDFKILILLFTKTEITLKKNPDLEKKMAQTIS